MPVIDTPSTELNTIYTLMNKSVETVDMINDGSNSDVQKPRFSVNRLCMPKLLK